MSFLEKINAPSDVKKLSVKELKILAEELREEIVSVTSVNGGHLSSNLGVTDLTLALYKVFDFPQDKLIFDVGHQCYAHKILSGRKKEFASIRCDGGISGFPSTEESDYDAFSTGHAGTSVSAGLGMCLARDKFGENFFVVDIVGDGSFVNGLNLEAITSSVKKPKKFIVILNDNGMSISHNKNGFYKLISKGTTKSGYIKSKNIFKKIFKNSFITRFFRKIRNFIKRIFIGSNFFENFGFKYVGVIDGNDMGELVSALTRIKNSSEYKAVLLHVKTVKGKGLKEAEEKSDLYHGVGKNMTTAKNPYSVALGEKLNEIIERDKTVVAITSGMKDGTGLKAVEEKFPDNFTDVGIAEEYAVTLSAGLAAGGLKPVVAIYSTFLQRSYDEILHDVCLSSYPVVFCVDRAGFVGADGKTHQGLFDLSYLSHIPQMNVYAPATPEELKIMLEYAIKSGLPTAIRYPSGGGKLTLPSVKIEDGLWQTVAGDKKAKVCLLAVGERTIVLAKEFYEKYKEEYGICVVNCRSVKPLDGKFLEEIKDSVIVTLEENTLMGGFGSLVRGYYADRGICAKTVSIGAKDGFVCHGTVEKQMKENGFTVDNIRLSVQKYL